MSFLLGECLFLLDKNSVFPTKKPKFASRFLSDFSNEHDQVKADKNKPAPNQPHVFPKLVVSNEIPFIFHKCLNYTLRMINSCAVCRAVTWWRTAHWRPLVFFYKKPLVFFISVCFYLDPCIIRKYDPADLIIWKNQRKIRLIRIDHVEFSFAIGNIDFCMDSLRNHHIPIKIRWANN